MRREGWVERRMRDVGRGMGRERVRESIFSPLSLFSLSLSLFSLSLSLFVSLSLLVVRVHPRTLMNEKISFQGPGRGKKRERGGGDG